jgi:hypothetical protein
MGHFYYLINYLLIAGVSYLLFSISYFNSQQVPMALLGNTLLILFSFPHFMATYRIWWKDKKSWKKEWLVIGSAIAFWIMAIFFFIFPNPDLVGHLLQASYFYLLYHFARQLYGVSLWNWYQAKFSVNVIKKIILNLFLLSFITYYWMSLQIHDVQQTIFYYTVNNYLISSSTLIGMFYLTFILFFLFMSLDAYSWFKEKKGLKHFTTYPIILLSVLWFLPTIQPAGWVLLLPVLHAIQYIPFWSKRLSSNWKILALNYLGFIIAGYVFFRVIPLQLNALMPRENYWFMIMITFLNVHHFFIDGRIWKLKDARNQVLLK